MALMTHARSAAIAGVAMVLAATTVGAQTFLCNPEVAGQLSYQASRRCECRFFAESKAHGTPSGYRWDCNILHTAAAARKSRPRSNPSTTAICPRP